MSPIFKTALWTLAIATVAWTASTRAEAPPSVKRSVLQKHDLHAAKQEGVMAMVEIPPGGREGRHTHPAEVFAYVLEGTATLDIEGKPAQTLKAADTFFIEPGQIHEVINNGTGPVKLVAVFFTDKGKPMTSQVQ